MIRKTIAALALAAGLSICGHAAAQAREGEYRLLTIGDTSAVMVGNIVTGPNHDRRFSVILVIREPTESGSDSFAFEFSADCTANTYRYTYTEAFSGTTRLTGGPADMEAKPPARDSLNESAHRYGCTGETTSDDTNLVKGIAAARSYARSRIPQ